jgi:hypothetical protein
MCGGAELGRDQPLCQYQLNTLMRESIYDE